MPARRRVAVRARRPTGSVPPFTDVVGHVEAQTPHLHLRTRAGALVVVDPADIVSLRELGPTPVSIAAIRSLEYAAARGWPGVQREELDGWLLRFGHGDTSRANSAVPLDVDGAAARGLAAAPRIAARYAARGLPPLLALPDRLTRVPDGVPTTKANVVMTAAVEEVAGGVGPDLRLTPEPDAGWLAASDRDVAVAELTAVVDGRVVFAAVERGGDTVAVGRAAVTDAPDGTRWVGVAAVHVVPAARRAGVARRLCSALFAWGAEQGATRAYVQVLLDNDAALALYDAMGFTPHHRVRYVDARDLAGGTDVGDAP